MITIMDAILAINPDAKVSIKHDLNVDPPVVDEITWHEGTTPISDINIAAKKAVNYMVDHLIANYDITGEEAYMLCSLAGDLKIAEVVDVPHMLVTMHFPKSILSQL